MNENVFLNRNFRLAFFGALVSELGTVFYSFAVGFYILEISGNNAFLQGLYLALCGVSLFIFTPLGGVIGDRYNKAKIMYLCDYAKGAIIIIATVLMLVFKTSSAHLIILFSIGILANGVSGVFTPAAGALLPHIIEEKKLQQANAYYSVKSAFQSIVGVVLAGIFYAVMPITLLFILVGVCYILSGVSEMFIRYHHEQSQEKMTVKLIISDIKEGFKYLSAQDAIKAFVIAIMFINFFFAPISGNFIPFFAKTDLAGASSYLFDKWITPELWTSVFSVLIGIGFMAGSIVLSTKKQEEKVGRKISIRICIIAGLLIIITLGYWLLVSKGVSINGFLILFCICTLIAGICVAAVNIPANTVLMVIVEKDKLSKVTSIIGIASQGMTPIASVLAGAVLQYMGSTSLLAICAIGFTITAAFLFTNKKAQEI